MIGDRYHLTADRTRLFAKDRDPIVLPTQPADPDAPPLLGRSRLSGLSALSMQATVDVRPSGAGYLRIEDMAGDDLQQKINAASATKPSDQMVRLTFPPGVFEFADFAQLGNSGLFIPPNVSIYGSGPGAGGTVFRMTPGSSTRAASVPVTGSGLTNPLQYIQVRSAAGSAGGQTPLNGLEYKNFSVLCTEQGHLYNGLRLQNTTGALVEDVYVEGCPGGSASPPGETFGVNVYLGSGATLRRVEVDGRRTRQGGTESIASSPIGINNHNGFVFEDCYVHHCQYGMPTAWQSSDGRTVNLRSEYNKTGMNSERCTRITHVNPRIVLSGRPHHFSFMNDQVDGVLTIIAPSWVPGTGNATKLVIFAGPRGSGVVDLQTAGSISVTDTAGNSILSQVLIAQ